MFSSGCLRPHLEMESIKGWFWLCCCCHCPITKRSWTSAILQIRNILCIWYNLLLFHGVFWLGLYLSYCNCQDNQDKLITQWPRDHQMSSIESEQHNTKSRTTNVLFFPGCPAEMNAVVPQILKKWCFNKCVSKLPVDSSPRGTAVFSLMVLESWEGMQFEKKAYSGRSCVH